MSDTNSHNAIASALPGGHWNAAHPLTRRGACAIFVARHTSRLLHWLGRMLQRKDSEPSQSIDPIRGRLLVHTVERIIATVVSPPFFRVLFRQGVIQPITDAPIAAVRLTTKASRAGSRQRILFLHGGSYCLERGPLHDILIRQIGAHTGIEVIALDFRLAPEHPFPCALEDALRCYQWLLEEHAPEEIAIVGDSAGAGLALALLQQARTQDLALPACLCLLCPWADLTFSGTSIIANAGRDPFMTNLDAITLFAEMYLAGASPSNPLISPVFGDFHGFPPTLIHAGSTDLLRSDAERVAAGLRHAGATVRFEVWDDMPHVWQRMGNSIPEAVESVRKMADFVRAAMRTDQAA